MSKIKEVTANTVQINSPDYSWGIFCFNDLGDLFLNSDWGIFMFSWRAFGDDFREFLSETNAEYLVGKFQINFRNMTKKAIPPHTKCAVTGLVELFINHLKENKQPEPESLPVKKKQPNQLKIERTGRGFAIIRFTDKLGVTCTMQKSSAAMVDAIWLGAEKIGVKQFIPNNNPSWIDRDEFDGENYVANNRMELTQKQVEQLLPYLQTFVETGEISEPEN